MLTPDPPLSPDAVKASHVQQFLMDEVMRLGAQVRQLQLVVIEAVKKSEPPTQRLLDRRRKKTERMRAYRARKRAAQAAATASATPGG